MKAELRILSLTFLFAGALALSACGNPVDTLPPDDNAGTGGTTAAGGTGTIGGAGGTAGTTTTGGTAGVNATGGSAGSTGGAAAGGSTSGSGGTAAGGSTSGSGGSAGSGAGSGGSSSVPPVTWQEVSFAVNGACAKSMCHNGMQEPTLLAIPAMDQYTVLTTHPISFCGAATRLVTPGSPANSALLKLANGECLLDGEPFIMPADCTQVPCLPAEQITAITNWISNGAPGPL